MKTAVLHGPHDWRIEEVNSSDPGKNECLIKIKACGVCHSEIHQWDHKIPGLEYPRYIGHEVAGIILKVGENVKNFKSGDKIAAWAEGKGYSEEIVVKEDTLEKIADGISFELALSEPIACTTNAIMKSNIQLGDTVALVGMGFMGLILLQELKLVGAKEIIAIDIREEMLKLSEELGADVMLNPLKDDVKTIIKEITGNKGVDVSFEVGGIESTLNLAADICRMEGKLIIFGYHPGPRKIEDLGYWNWMAFDIINAHFRDMKTILKGTHIGMELLNSGKIKMDKLITHRFRLDEIEDAFMAAKNKPKGFVKSVIVND
jgi:2-desacetyl-2-hydroxyethyl bacteriochlorophyllide A dehydrogenase